jgi:hypothetical protein
VKSAVSPFAQPCCQTVVPRLSETTRERLAAVLTAEPSETAAGAPECRQSPHRVVLQELRAAPGRATLENLLREIAKLERVRSGALPDELVAQVAPKVLPASRRRAAMEAA